MEAPIPYYGSKGIMGPRIAALLPPHEHYVECFAGSLAVLLVKRQSRLETVNDLDEHLVTFWRVVRDRPQDLVDLLDATPHSRAEFKVALDLDGPLSDVERARRVFTRIVQGRMGTLVKTGWRFKVAPDSNATIMADEIARFRRRIIGVSERIRRVQVECMPALDMILRYGVEPSNLLYLDPPYVAESRASVGHYRMEMPDEERHRAMAKAAAECKAAVVVSGYRSDLYAELFEGWYVEELPTQTMAGGARKATCEVLWSNRPLGGRVQERLFE